MYYNTAGLNV